MIQVRRHCTDCEPQRAEDPNPIDMRSLFAVALPTRLAARKLSGILALAQAQMAAQRVSTAIRCPGFGKDAKSSPS